MDKCFDTQIDLKNASDIPSKCCKRLRSLFSSMTLGYRPLLSVSGQIS